MAQADTHKITIAQIIANPIFNEGYKDAMAGVGFYEKYDRLADHQRFAYERGRHFFFAVGKMRIKQGAGASKEAIRKFASFFRERVVL